MEIYYDYIIFDKRNKTRINLFKQKQYDNFSKKWINFVKIEKVI